MTVRGLLCDLDGVVYRGDEACPGAVEGLSAAREAGVRVLFMTNNASRTPQDVAEHLTALGLPTGADDVLTASQVAAAVLADRFASGDETLPEGSTILAVGGSGVAIALAEAGLGQVGPGEVRQSHEDGEPLTVGMVVQGYGPSVDALALSEAAYAIREGAGWLATNDDRTIPTARGLGVGNGSLLAAVASATGASPEVVGKPHAPAYEHAVRRLGLPVEECLMIGDRLDTDIAGAARAGIRSALVLTGVSQEADVEQVPEELRPDHIAATIPDLEHLWTKN
ncbi:HAD-IIA family hydrolase [Ornithinimicrobium panacihumi]|uniref:HAD-IIA family hydrolase n=1 Tax=Ornithinimicrobium panacihumi TaxID=2008449 RepID=UPI003F8B8FD2